MWWLQHPAVMWLPSVTFPSDFTWAKSLENPARKVASRSCYLFSQGTAYGMREPRDLILHSVLQHSSPYTLTQCCSSPHFIVLTCPLDSSQAIQDSWLPASFPSDYACGKLAGSHNHISPCLMTHDIYLTAVRTATAAITWRYGLMILHFMTALLNDGHSSPNDCHEVRITYYL